MSAQSKLNEVLVRWDAEVRNFAEATTADAKASVEWEYFAAAERARSVTPRSPLATSSRSKTSTIGC